MLVRRVKSTPVPKGRVRTSRNAQIKVVHSSSSSTTASSLEPPTTIPQFAPVANGLDNGSVRSTSPSPNVPVQIKVGARGQTREVKKTAGFGNDQDHTAAIAQHSRAFVEPRISTNVFGTELDYVSVQSPRISVKTPVQQGHGASGGDDHTAIHSMASLGTRGSQTDGKGGFDDLSHVQSICSANRAELESVSSRLNQLLSKRKKREATEKDMRIKRMILKQQLQIERLKCASLLAAASSSVSSIGGASALASPRQVKPILHSQPPSTSRPPSLPTPVRSPNLPIFDSKKEAIDFLEDDMDLANGVEVVFAKNESNVILKQMLHFKTSSE